MLKETEWNKYNIKNLQFYFFIIKPLITSAAIIFSQNMEMFYAKFSLFKYFRIA